MVSRVYIVVSLSLVLLCGACQSQVRAQPAQGAEAERPVAFPFITIDRAAGEVRIEAEVIDVQMPLEFFMVSRGGPDHESVVRTDARPSHIHAALLLLGLEPGSPVRYSEAADRWLPPSGPPVQIFAEWEGQARIPATRLMKRIEGTATMPARTWVFAGSRMLDEGDYAADITGQLVAIVNFDYSVLDVAGLVSNANETLEWEANKALLPEPGTAVTVVLKPVEAAAAGVDREAPAEAVPPADKPLDVTLLTARADGSLT
ncbi:MAG: YdjY domain-containing protein, partial [Phycisphaerae bacterium]